jgi:cytochrome c-type biogenesis protein
MGLGLPFIATGVYFDKSEPLRKFLIKRGKFISQAGGTLLILIGALQVTGVWGDLMISLRSLISEFTPVI